MQTLYTLPREERLKVRQEVWMHLDSIIQEEVARGKDLDEAISAAFRRFGDPHKIGRNIRKAWLQKHPVRTQQPLPKSRARWVIGALCFAALIALEQFLPGYMDADRQPDPQMAIKHGLVSGFFFW